MDGRLCFTTSQTFDIAICEPFVLRCGAVNDNCFSEFTHRRQAAQKVANELSLEWIAFQTMFDEATTVAPPCYWAADGVHSTLAGHALMAETRRHSLGLWTIRHREPG